MAKEKLSSAAAATSPEQDSELGRLREILYGSQKRATEERLNDVERRLEEARSELGEAIREHVARVDQSAGESIERTHTELIQIVERTAQSQTADLSGLRLEFDQRLKQAGDGHAETVKNTEQTLGARLDALREETQLALNATRDALQAETRRGLEELAGQLLAFQNEARQRDEELRRELLRMTGGLDERKASRADLSQLLVQMGRALHAGPEEGSEDAPTAVSHDGSVDG